MRVWAGVWVCEYLREYLDALSSTTLIRGPSLFRPCISFCLSNAWRRARTCLTSGCLMQTTRSLWCVRKIFLASSRWFMLSLFRSACTCCMFVCVCEVYEWSWVCVWVCLGVVLHVCVSYVCVCRRVYTTPSPSLDRPHCRRLRQSPPLHSYPRSLSSSSYTWYRSTTSVWDQK